MRLDTSFCKYKKRAVKKKLLIHKQIYTAMITHNNIAKITKTGNKCCKDDGCAHTGVEGLWFRNVSPGLNRLKFLALATAAAAAVTGRRRVMTTQHLAAPCIL